MKTRFFNILSLTTIFSFLLLSCENGEAPIDVAQEGARRTMEDEVSTFDALPEHIKESLLYSTTILKEAAKQVKGKTTEFGEIVPDMAIERKYEDGTTSYTLGLRKLEEGLYYDNIALQEYDDGSTESFIIRYWPSLEWLKDFYGQEDRYEHYTGTMEVYDGEGTIKSRLDLVEGELVDSKAFNNSTNRCIVHHRVSIGCVYSCWISEIEITYICHSSGGGGFGGGDFDDPDTGGGGSGGGSGGELGDINVTPIDDIVIIPPSCKSFKFQNVNSNWQEASVKNIRFNVTVFEIVGGIRVRKHHTVWFTQPVKFGMPRKFSNGTTIPAGLAAEIGARAINHAIDDVVSKYYTLVVSSTSVIANDFRENLINEFRELSNGGRVNFNDMSGTPIPTEYETYGVFPDNCY